MAAKLTFPLGKLNKEVLLTDSGFLAHMIKNTLLAFNDSTHL
jgi:hypothetical protein